MSDGHQNLGPELRQLAQTILDGLDPALRLAAARATSAGPGKCQQVWCPVCALGALINGEGHPLLTVIAEHSVALLAVVRAMTEPSADDRPEPPDPSAPQGPPSPEPDPPSSGPSSGSRSGPGRYQHIPVSVEE